MTEKLTSREAITAHCAGIFETKIRNLLCELIRLDADAMTALFAMRVVCNDALATALPSADVTTSEQTVGMIGALNDARQAGRTIGLIDVLNRLVRPQPDGTGRLDVRYNKNREPRVILAPVAALGASPCKSVCPSDTDTSQ